MALPGIIRGKRITPRRTLCYGTPGIGKSTFGAHAPSPIVISIEDGLDDIGCDRTPVLRETTEVAQWLMLLGSEAEQHDYKTVVIDSLDWLEKLIWTATCREAGKNSLEDFGYGKGYLFATKRWEQLLLMLDCCRMRGMNVVLLAHAKVEKFSPPDADAYDRWQPDLHKTAWPMIKEWCDEVLFAKYDVSTITREEGFGQKRTRAVGSADRVLYTCEQPTHVAKRRIQMPDKIALDWSEYQKHWPTGNVPTGDINGIVTDGSSKKKKEVVQ
jgi:hypothetical protein